MEAVLENERHCIEAKLGRLFSEVLNVEVSSAEEDLFESGLLDSQKFVELLLGLEERFDVHISVDDFEAENFRCLTNIATLVLQHKTSVRDS
jgi:D-alanine--poly(phosphoribitol) ligase subunit 2